jgi:hypothetical protein
MTRFPIVGPHKSPKISCSGTLLSHHDYQHTLETLAVELRVEDTLPGSEQGLFQLEVDRAQGSISPENMR